MRQASKGIKCQVDSFGQAQILPAHASDTYRSPATCVSIFNLWLEKRSCQALEPYKGTCFVMRLSFEAILRVKTRVPLTAVQTWSAQVHGISNIYTAM